MSGQIRSPAVLTPLPGINPVPIIRSLIIHNLMSFGKLQRTFYLDKIHPLGNCLSCGLIFKKGKVIPLLEDACWPLVPKFAGSNPAEAVKWLRYCATYQKIAGSIPDGVMEFFIDINPFVRTMALGSTQPLTEMSTGSIFWG
jgi:hypothetical protein